MFVHPETRAPLARLRAHHTGAARAGDDVVFVVDGVPILVPDPVTWCGRHRDGVIAAVATMGGDVAAVVAGLDAVIGDARQPQAPFVDDFTPEEARDAPPPALVDAALQDLLDDGTTPLAFLAKHVPAAGVIVELGPGAGGLSSLLGPRAKRKLVVMDLSLRSVLLARRAGGPRTVGVVADACALPIADDAADVIVAENVIDVVDDADAMLAGMHRALRRGGTLALTTPGPELDGGDDVDARVRAAGFTIDTVLDGLRWPRVHGRRHVELWTSRGLVARRR
jgi:SAM-dependent methyltransferase